MHLLVDEMAQVVHELSVVLQYQVTPMEHSILRENVERQVHVF